MDRFVILGSSVSELVEKKSRFIGQAFEVHSEEETNAIIEGTRKKYWDARHNCYAYVLGASGETKRFSDDKEPQGTAGRPILDVITGQMLTNTLVIVTRYFGGILLGTGGLARAYSKATEMALEAAGQNGSLLPLTFGRRITLFCEYKDLGKIETSVLKAGVFILSKDYADKALFTLAVPEGVSGKFAAEIQNITCGSISLPEGEPCTFCTKGQEAVIYNIIQ